MDDQPRRPLRIVGSGSPAISAPGPAIYSPRVCLLLRDFQGLTPAERAEFSLAIGSIAKHGEALRTVAVNFQIQEQIDALGEV